eukprot:gnl/TRDRNA2_/TRDRNA2_158146_c0_seq2.p1 gnl/TRDRNA2_/TRDRNA2_158146_c0~~gnl/TRDRNA2_/TRDRNA2_158146_c0_seq2.p1  ORF type:complete len:267 (-),score=24.22 gnl/TRDRNA2_/TRDRNA2_158146_c0_seq2:197-997(-)
MVERIGMTIGSSLAVWFTCRFLDDRTLASVGLILDRAFCIDAATGLAVGTVIVAFIFCVELCFGWIVILQCFEVFDRSESFSRCILQEVVFHLGVALNEELPVRGWILYNFAEALCVYSDLQPTSAFVISMLNQSSLFAIMHLASPGGAEVLSIINMLIAGVAAGFNVLLTGGRLGLVLGWHFGWNISMGNLFGLSTSGIPISATFISVAPHPDKKVQHGGVFGPEGGVVAPAAFLLGIYLSILIYGWPTDTPSDWLLMALNETSR